MSEVSAEIIAKTQKSLGKYVKKPVLSEKLLKKPPFRFLHDIIKAVIKETGFLNELFSDDELNSENVKEKEAKVAFLTKLIDAVKTVSKTDLKVRPSKIVAGLEPAETNVLLQTIAKSIDRKVETKDYVAKRNSGEIAVNEKNTKHEKDKEKKSGLKESTKKETKIRESSVTRVKKAASNETPKSTDRARESSRSKTRDQKKDKSIKTKDNKDDESNKKESRHKEAEKKVEKKKTVIKSNNEQNSGRHIKSNSISANHNIHTNGIASVDGNDVDISKISDTITPNTATNNDTVGINETISLLSATEKELAQNHQNLVSNPDEATLLNFSNARQGSAGLIRPKSARPKSGDRIPSSKGRRDLNQEIKGRGELEEKHNGPVEVNAIAPASMIRPSSSLRPPSVRPSSARPGAPRLRPESALPTSEPVPMGNINVIVENFDSGLGDDEDTVVIQHAPEITETDVLPASELLLNISGENKGQLVEQILEQIQEGQEEGVRKKVEIDWEQDGLRGKDATTKEVTQLRSFIQSLTKTANPLGKLMNYLHEDLDAMHNELQMWTNTKKQLYMEIEKQKKLAVESSKPLLDKLDHLRQEITKQENEIMAARSNILRNEQRISELLGNK